MTEKEPPKESAIDVLRREIDDRVKDLLDRLAQLEARIKRLEEEMW